MNGIIFIAPPAAGKGTQSNILSSKYNIPHISTGDLIRASRNNGSNEYIKQAQSGGLVDDDFVINLVYNELKKSDCDNGYILDGFPRNINQAKKLDDILKKLNKKLGYVFLLDINYELSRNRIVGRISCPECGKVYNTLDSLSKPKIPNKCDICNTDLVRRQDDNEETFKNRYDVYLNETSPLIDFYQEKGLLHKIDASMSIEDISRKIIEVIDYDNN